MTATNREWRFADALASDPQPVPEQWLEAGHREEPVAGQVQTHPVLFRAGEELQYEVRAGGVYNGPERDRSAVCVLYALEDGTGAHERIYPARRGDDAVAPRDEFAAVASVDEAALSTPAEYLQRLYALLVDARQEGDDVQQLFETWKRNRQRRPSTVGCGP
jgi:hypothetical protein